MFDHTHIHFALQPRLADRLQLIVDERLPHQRKQRPDDFAAAARIAAKVAKAVNAAVSCDGINLMQANGEGAGQSVGHVHLHIIPRRKADGLLFNWEPKPGERDHIAAVAARIREFL